MHSALAALSIQAMNILVMLEPKFSSHKAAEFFFEVMNRDKEALEKLAVTMRAKATSLYADGDECEKQAVRLSEEG